MNRVTINLEALEHNYRTLDRMIQRHGASWTIVTKVLCGHEDSLAALARFGVRSVGESRLMNLHSVARAMPETERWYLRPPHPSRVKEIVEFAQVSLNSEIPVIEAINHEAGRRGVKHRVVIMIELGDLREGILPGSLLGFYERVMSFPHVQVLGVGANLGCLSGAVPTIDQLAQLVLYKELLELKFGHTLPLISAGSSAVLPLLVRESIPRSINHFRVGESLFLGSDLIHGGVVDGLRDDVVRVEAEIAEIKEKSLTPMGETADISPFGGCGAASESSPGQRGYRALVTLGQLDTDISGLQPEESSFQIAGASSDITAINLGDSPCGLEVGDTINFRVSYSALLRLMNGRYIDKVMI